MHKVVDVSYDIITYFVQLDFLFLVSLVSKCIIVISQEFTQIVEMAKHTFNKQCVYV